MNPRQRQDPPKKPSHEDAMRAERIDAGVAGFISAVKHILSTTKGDRLMKSMTPAEARYIVEHTTAAYIERKVAQERAEEEARLIDDPLDDLFV